jgi:general stress protein 13
MIELTQSYGINDIIEGKIKQIQSYGAFIDFPSGQKGLLHISEVSNKFVRQLDLILSEGDLVRVKVISIDPRNQYLRVSLKQVPIEDNPVPHHNRSSKVKVPLSQIDFNPLKEALPKWIETKLNNKEK